jgi:hypothetical protein
VTAVAKNAIRNILWDQTPMMGYALTPCASRAPCTPLLNQIFKQEDIMHNFTRVFCLTWLSFALALMTEPVRAQTAKDLIGTWVATSNVSEQNGVKSNPYGSPPLGMLIFDADGHYGLILSRPDIPKFASNNRTSGTTDENKAAVQGTISHFGRYTVSEPDKTITFKIETSTYPNSNGTEQKRPFTLKGDELVYTVPAFSGGGSAVSTWKRAK